MEKLTFSTVINATKEKVWNTMLEKYSYEEWTTAFHEGSTYEGAWEEGSEMKFIGPNDDGTVGGMYALIAASRPYEFVSIKHLGELRGEEKIPWPVVEGEEGYENYTFSEVVGGTEVTVDLMVPAEWKDVFADMWPRALQKLKEVAER